MARKKLTPKNPHDQRKAPFIAGPCFLALALLIYMVPGFSPQNGLFINILCWILIATFSGTLVMSFVVFDRYDQIEREQILLKTIEAHPRSNIFEWACAGILFLTAWEQGWEILALAFVALETGVHLSWQKFKWDAEHPGLWFAYEGNSTAPFYACRDERDLYDDVQNHRVIASLSKGRCVRLRGKAASRALKLMAETPCAAFEEPKRIVHHG